MKLLGSAVDENGPQMFVLTGPANAVWWRGATNGKKKSDEEGSHWDLAFNLVHPDDDDGEGGKTRSVTLEGGAIDVLSFGSSGWVLAYEVDERIVLVDGSFDEKLESKVKSEAGGTENVPRHEGFEKYVTAPPRKKSTSKHVFDAPDGWVLLMSASSSFTKLKRDRKRATKPFELAELDAMKERVLQLDDGSGGHALLLRLKKGRVLVTTEPEVDGPWGSAERAVLSPA